MELGKCGVLQSTTLGPLLFLLYLDKLSTVAKSSAIILADDKVSETYAQFSFVDVEINLAGSVTPSISEDEMSTTEKSEDDTALEAHPDLRIKLTKPSGRSLVFNCSLPGHDAEKQLSEDESNDLPTYSVDSVEIERIPGYFVYTDLFDDDMYNHTMQLLVERGLDADFQQELQNFCTSEEHKLYLKFLDEFQNYCKD
ncbi:unnamed protein product [Schistosoma curassoni]|uniref:Complement component 1 Q subcomponent-binding protein, mitochondrial n=1 Tax=Schistosoma curassoni TaxID=6186 RepID=A0A183K070_9TREM|nr:unnamed protein product [Schistosoma curassoni]